VWYRRNLHELSRRLWLWLRPSVRERRLLHQAMHGQDVRKRRLRRRLRHVPARNRVRRRALRRLWWRRLRQHRELPDVSRGLRLREQW